HEPSVPALRSANPLTVPENRRSMLAAMKVAFIGLGKMGSGMARNLLSAGHQITAYNRTRQKSEALEKDGARVADSAAAACQGAEAVITMLADDHAVEEMVFG